jgi:hypothetical protein
VRELGLPELDALVPSAVTTRSLCGQVAVVVPRPSGTATQVLGLRATEARDEHDHREHSALYPARHGRRPR